ncbi:MAG TPA: MFS transporter [Caulobacteraceae bacterium]|jgi:GPH family glycoside/pentoside/hexuronide:cation symporter|nr:MFS transporter [Caulobacteraceae bacterium]
MQVGRGTPSGRLSLATILAFSAANLPIAALGVAVFVYLPPYFAGHLAVPMAVVGGVWMGVRLFDIPVDVGLAMLMDRTHTPVGRYRFWLMLGAPLLSVSLYKLYMAPHGFGWGFLTVWLLVLYLAMSIVNLSSSAWGATLATLYHERSRLFGVQTAVGVFGAVAIILIPVLGQGFHANDAASVQAMGWAMAALTPVAIAITSIFTPERVARDIVASHKVDWKEVWAVLSKPDLLRLFLAQTSLTLGPGWMSGLYIFFFTQARGYSVQQASLLLAIYILAGVPGALGAANLAKRIGKHRTLMVSTTAYSLGLFSVLIPLKGNMPLGVITMCWCGAMASSFGLMIQAMLADVGDEVRLEQGKERISLVYALNGLAAKIAGALSIGLSFPLLALLGFNAAEGASNTPEAIVRLTWAFIAGPIIFVMLGGACVVGWRMDARRQHEIRQALDAREAAAVAPAALLVTREIDFVEVEVDISQV